ncbi:MAG: hypothetical protein HQL91_13000 [Magnetococcales bacterium]|nr:hypothetical protein [Magnetococcales bacterium]
MYRELQSEPQSIRSSLAPIGVSVALLTAMIGAPAPAKADPTLTAVAAVSTAVVIGSLFMTHSGGSVSPSMGGGAVIYTSVSPVAQVAPAGSSAQAQPVVMATTTPLSTPPVSYYAVPTLPMQMVVPVPGAKAP